MELKRFFKIMHLVVFKKESKATFLLNLITLFIKGEEIEGANDENNPLRDLKDNTLGKIYKGDSQISRNNAIKICERLDKNKFINYLENLWSENDDDYNILVEKIPGEGDVLIRCANIFEEIITEIATKERKNNTSEKQPENDNSLETSEVVDAEMAMATFTYTNCCQCRSWRGDKKSAIIDKNVVRGKCSLLNKDTLSNDGNGCPKFRTSASFNIMDIINPNK